jgi:D-serine deaminase-like pyridoxal phosphate-dependent protein
MTLPASLDLLGTPALLLDEGRMDRNIADMRRRLARFDITFRPHLKTCKSVEIARRMMDSPAGPATVSTLREAEIFAAAGVADILYAVGIVPAKLDQVAALRRTGCDLKIILDSIEQADAVAERGTALGMTFPVLIEIDSDGHRAGLLPADPRLVEVARRANTGGSELIGVMTHAGGSYDVPGVDAITAAAERERAAVVAAASAIRDAGLPCPVVSVGSTPTARFASDLTGVTEVRAGVFVFHDLVMAGLGVCAVDDIAISVLTRVIGHQREKGWTVVDAGWMAMSRDRGTARQPTDQGYGLVCDVAGQPIPDLVMIAANQEHGIIAARDGSGAKPVDLPVGTLLRILPNHACATAAQFGAYEIMGNEGAVTDRWLRFGGW